MTLAKPHYKHRTNGFKGAHYTKNDLIFYIAILVLPIIQVAIFYVGVNFQTILMAFQKYDAVENVYIWDAAKNINRFATEVSTSGFWIMIKNSVIVWVCGSVAGTALAVFFSYYIYKKRTAYNFFKFVLFLPSILPGIILVTMFSIFTQEAVPAFAKLWFNQDVVNFITDANSRFWVVTIYGLWLSFGGSVLIYTGAMDQIPNEIIEAGKLDGVTTLREFFSIVVPYILPTMATFLVAGIATIFTNQNNLFNFFGFQAMPEDKTFGYYLYTLVASDGNGKSGYCYAAFLGLLSTIIALPLTLLARKFFERLQK